MFMLKIPTTINPLDVEEEISERLIRILKRSFAEVLNISKREKVDI